MTSDPISRFRRFNRAVTSGLGVLDNSFLGLGRALGPARVLNAIGHGYGDVGALRDYLGLDSGLLSRLLRGLETEGLIETAPHPLDARRRLARLTESGARAFAAYEDLSNAHAQRILAQQKDPAALLAAMDLIATAFARDQVTLAEVDPRSPAALECLSAYYAELGARLAQGFDVNLSADPQAPDMMRPKGAFLVALSDGMPLGCVGLKGTAKGYAEIKRLWVAPSARGLGLARRLMAGAEDAARALGIDTLRLDSNNALHEAIAMYRRDGWTEIPRFNDDPYPDVFFEKRLLPA